MRRTLLLFLAVCILIAVWWILTVQVHRRSPLDKALAGLASSDFSEVRRSQEAIIQVGTNALPSLLKTLDTSANTTQKALCYYLIGTLAPETYCDLLLLASQKGSGEFQSAFKYVNPEGLSKLTASRILAVKAAFARLRGQIMDQNEADATADLLDSISGAK